MMDGIKQIAEKVSKLYARLLQKRYIEVKEGGKTSFVWK